MAGRGIDFEHRFNTSRWAEDLLLNSLNAQDNFLAVRFGLSRVRAAKDVVYDKAGWKEPDLLVYDAKALTAQERKWLDGRDLSLEARESFEKGRENNFAVSKAAAAIEVEFSPYRASEMKGRTWIPKTPAQWERRPLKNANPPTAPNIWVKEEDLGRLNAWQAAFEVPILIAHLFDQEAFAVALEKVSTFNDKFETQGTNPIELQMTTGIFKKEQSYDRQDAQGAGEHKTVFVITPGVAVRVGEVKKVQVKAQLGVSASKKYVTHSIFSGGEISFTPEFLQMLLSARQH
jgi:hypothetical protein